MLVVTVTGASSMCTVGMEGEHVCIQAIAAREGAGADVAEEGLDIGVDA